MVLRVKQVTQSINNQATTINAYRLHDMKADLHEVNPLDQKWGVENYADVEPISCDIPSVWSNESVSVYMKVILSSLFI
jgi:hypothetical protein